MVKLKYLEVQRRHESKPEIRVTLDFYSNDDQERLIKLERDLRSVEKILNCVQIEDPWLQCYALQNSLSIKKSIMGRKVVIDKRLLFKEELEDRDCDEFLKSLLITKKIHKMVTEDPEETQIHLVTSIENLGKCYATIEFITSFLHPKTAQPITLVAIDLSPVEARLKLFKLVLNTADIKSIFKATVENILNDKARLLQLFQRVVSSLLVVRRVNYSLPMVPHRNVDSQSLKHVEDVKDYYYNSFDKYELLERTGLEFHPFMRRVHKEAWVTHSKVVRCGRDYVVVTVEKHMSLRCHCLRMYMPKTGRHLHATLYYHDMLGLSQSFSQKVFAISPAEYDHLLSLSNYSYQEFSQLAENHLKTQAGVGMSSYSAQDYLSTFSNSETLTNKQMSKAALRGKLVDRIDNRSYAEMHVWDKILKHMNLALSNHSRKFAVAIDNFSGAVGECLFKELYRGSHGLLYWTEIYLERTGEPTDPFAPSPVIRFEDLDLFQLVVKLRLISPQVTHNDKMNLRKVFDLYAKDQGLAVDKKLKESYLVTQARLAHIAYFVAQRVTRNAKNVDMVANVDSQDRENTLSKQYFFQEQFERKMKTNSRIVAAG